MNRDRKIVRSLACFFSLGFLGVVLLSGCGGGHGNLAGKVTYKDKPVRVGTVLVTASNGTVTSTVIQDDGTYSLSNVVVGPAKIAVTSQDPKSVKVALRKKGDTPPPTDSSKWFAIPEKYADFDKSDLKYPVAGGSNTFNLDLK